MSETSRWPGLTLIVSHYAVVQAGVHTELLQVCGMKALSLLMKLHLCYNL